MEISSLVIAHYHGGIDEIWLRVLHNSFEVVGLNFVYIWTSNKIAYRTNIILSIK